MSKQKQSQHRLATIKDVALAAGVSPMTVSNVVNGRFHQMASVTRRKIEEAIETLNYRPHVLGRNLRRTERLMIGMVIVDESRMFLAHPAHNHLLAGLSNFLSEEGYSLTIQGVRPSEVPKALTLRSVGTDALCALMSGEWRRRKRFLDVFTNSGQPLVVFHEHRLPTDGDICGVREDDAGGGALLARHLLERGCRRLVMLVPRAVWPAMEERLRGVRAAIRESCHRVRLDIISCGAASLEETQEALGAHVDAHGFPDGILAGHDQMGIAALKFARMRGVAAPEQLKITGFNAFEFRKYSDPVLTTVRAPTYELGVKAGEEILARLRTGAFSQREIVLPLALELGGST